MEIEVRINEIREVHQERYEVVGRESKIIWLFSSHARGS
jgi:hypothetical protein